MKKLFATMLALAVSVDCSAASGWTGFRTILGLETVSNGIEIRLSGYSGACGSVNEGGVQKTWVKIENNQPNEKMHMAAIMMAFAMGKQISIYCSTESAWPLLNNIIIQS